MCVCVCVCVSYHSYKKQQSYPCTTPNSWSLHWIRNLLSMKQQLKFMCNVNERQSLQRQIHISGCCSSGCCSGRAHFRYSAGLCENCRAQSSTVTNFSTRISVLPCYLSFHLYSILKIILILGLSGRQAGKSLKLSNKVVLFRISGSTVLVRNLLSHWFFPVLFVSV